MCWQVFVQYNDVESMRRHRAPPAYAVTNRGTEKPRLEMPERMFDGQQVVAKLLGGDFGTIRVRQKHDNSVA